MWLRIDDGYDNDPMILNLSRNRGEADRILGMITALMLYCARHRTNGFVPELIVREHIRSPRMRALFTGSADGGPSLLHPRGTECECLEGRQWPATGVAYMVHHYLRFNPTAEEYDVKRAKEAELRDRELQVAVRRRDGDRCRYCGTPVQFADRRSSRGLVLDHVDPAVAAGAANLVVACRGCNSRKGARTPAAAGMTLLPAPVGTPGPVWTPNPWSDPADQTANLSTDQGDDLQKTNWSPSGPTTHVPVRDGTGRETDPPPLRPPANIPTSRNPAGDAGPNGHRTQVGPAPPRPSSLHTDPYRRTAITGPDPADHAGLPTEDESEFP